MSPSDPYLLVDREPALLPGSFRGYESPAPGGPAQRRVTGGHYKWLGAVKIAISGTHSTGKTTTLRCACDRLRSAGLSVDIVPEMSSHCPLPIARAQTIESTLWIVLSMIRCEIERSAICDVLLVDRPVADAFAYLVAAQAARDAQPERPSPTYRSLVALIRHWSPTYRCVFRTCALPGLRIEDDGRRDLDENFRASVEAIMPRVDRRLGQHVLPLAGNVDADADAIAAAAAAAARQMLCPAPPRRPRTTG